MAKVTLDRETFKALASETRLDVLHALDERRKTGSELARELDLNKATVHEHLGILEATGLAQKQDEGRKWIYWELTWQGRKLLHPEQGATFSVLLGLGALAMGGGIVTLGRALGWWLLDQATGDDAGLTPEGAAEDTATQQAIMADEGLADSPPVAEHGFFDDGGWIALALVLTAFIAVTLAIWLRRRR